ncbi:MAG: hypothetical protein AB7T32_03575 [Dehalococcoidia bacterium]
MPRIILDFDPAFDDATQMAGDSADLVYFLSWAFSARYGASHELAEASMLLRGEFGIDLRPLLTFADRDVEMEADAEMLEKAWQDAAPLAASCSAVVEALSGDDTRLVAIRTDYPALSSQIAELGRIAGLSADNRSRIRVTFEME